jgi:hypothetical protein
MVPLAEIPLYVWIALGVMILVLLIAGLARATTSCK